MGFERNKKLIPGDRVEKKGMAKIITCILRRGKSHFLFIGRTILCSHGGRKHSEESRNKSGFAFFDLGSMREIIETRRFCYEED